MIGKKKRINNPLNLIAVFCGIPLGSIYAIKYVNPELQLVVILFAITYSILLTLLTFVILFYKQEAWYSPNDFKDEKNFLITLRLNKKPENEKKLARDKI